MYVSVSIDFLKISLIFSTTVEKYYDSFDEYSQKWRKFNIAYKITTISFLQWANWKRGSEVKLNSLTVNKSRLINSDVSFRLV